MFTLFKDEDVFSPEHVPDVFLYREPQMNALQYCLRPAIRNSRPVNALLVGNPATGKTTAVTIALQQLGETSNAACVHVHCANTTTYRILSEVHKKAVGFLPPETGIPITKIQDDIFRKLGKRCLVVALDDVSSIKDVEEALYLLLRAHEMHPGTRAGVLVISTKNELHRLDSKTRSSFSPEMISFTPYTRQQISDILKRRAEAGFYPDVAPAGIIKSIAENSDDLRTSIEMLRSAALKAEAEGKRRIGREHARTEERQKEKDPVAEALSKGPLDSGALYKKLGGSYSKFYRALKRLESEGKIRSRYIQKGKGKSRLIEAVN